jgi:L-threonylcarbamoyladenylate synthase
MKEIVAETVEKLKAGLTILYPTDTIWGLGCDALNPDAIQAVFLLKERPKNKSFIVLVDSVPMLERYIKEIPEVCYDIIDLSDKPTTIIYDNPIQLPDSLHAEDGSIGIRVTNDPFCKAVIRQLKRPIVSTSANISGAPNATCFDEIDPKIIQNVGYIAKWRTKEKMTTPSAIIKIDSSANIHIIRK